MNVQVNLAISFGAKKPKAKKARKQPLSKKPGNMRGSVANSANQSRRIRPSDTISQMRAPSSKPAA